MRFRTAVTYPFPVFVGKVMFVFVVPVVLLVRVFIVFERGNDAAVVPGIVQELDLQLFIAIYRSSCYL